VRAPGRGVSSALQGSLPAGCRPAAYSCGIAFAELMSGRAEAPGCDSHPGARAWPWRQQCVGRALYPRAAALRLMCGGSPGLCFVRWCARLVVASAVRWQGTLPAGCRPAAYVWRKPRVVFRTLVRAPGRGVSSALAGHFTRGLPPCGLCVAEAPGCVWHTGAPASLIPSSLHFLRSTLSPGLKRLRQSCWFRAVFARSGCLTGRSCDAIRFAALLWMKNC
jgi:hypothetical protein